MTELDTTELSMHDTTDDDFGYLRVDSEARPASRMTTTWRASRTRGDGARRLST